MDYYFRITKQNFARMFSKISLKLSSLAFYTILIKILLFCSFKKCPITASFIYSTGENAALSASDKYHKIQNTVHLDSFIIQISDLAEISKFWVYSFQHHSHFCVVLIRAK